MSRTRGRVVGLTSIGKSRSPDSITKSTSRSVVVRQCVISGVPDRCEHSRRTTRLGRHRRPVQALASDSRYGEPRCASLLVRRLRHHQCHPLAARGSKQIRPEPRRAPTERFPVTERPQLYVRGASGQRLRNLAHQERFAEPVRMKRPLRRGRSLSTARFTASSRSGCRCTSPSVSWGALRRRSSAADRARSCVSGSSSECQSRSWANRSNCTSVPLPVCRAPMTTTTGETVSARSSRLEAKRGRFAGATMA